MTQSIIDGQRLLVAVSAVGRGFALILAVEGEVAAEEIAAVSPHVDDHGSLADKMPKEPGIYVWDGRIIAEDGRGAGEYGGQGDADFEWQGEWSRASVADLLVFRFHVRTVCSRHGVVREIDADGKMFCRACKAAAGAASGRSKRERAQLSAEMVERLRRDGQHAPDCAVWGFIHVLGGVAAAPCDCHLSRPVKFFIDDDAPTGPVIVGD